jgi:hypothetical protein
MESYPTSDTYSGARAVLATKHAKEAVIADPFRQLLRLSIVVPDSIDTDFVGTHTGEVRRSKDLVEAARLKARRGMEAMGLRYGLASEGEFSPDPEHGGRGRSHEVLLFIDDEREVELVEEIELDASNYAVWVSDSLSSIEGELQHVGFPEQALTVKPRQGDLRTLVFKGIRHRRVLDLAIQYCCEFSEDGKAVVETDMRAHQNPARMATLAKLAERLATRLAAGQKIPES